ncbi:ribbon-helix-helix protein, CopG family [Planotetraspora thailandica]|nr:ribbon-helix-helix protein, CopG family [Planotetraspora thailandica]
MVFPMPSRHEPSDDGEPGSTPRTSLWLAPSGGQAENADKQFSVTVHFDRKDLEALSERARADGVMISDVIRAAVRREVGNKAHVVRLVQRWNLHREDMDEAADALGVTRMSDDEWHGMADGKGPGV